MSSGIWLAASGAAARVAALDSTANNLANVNTPGFKGDRALFQEHLIKAAYVGKSRDEMRYAGVSEIAVDHSPGPIIVTNRTLDLALRGPGFFAVMTPQGERYTRAGAFHVGPTGSIMTGEGYAVLGAGGQPMQVSPEEGEARFSPDGALLVGGEERGQLKVVSFQSPEKLERVGDKLFRATATSGAAVTEAPAVEVGAIETANVSIVRGMTDLVSATRAFETLQRAVEAFSEVERRAAGEIARVG